MQKRHSNWKGDSQWKNVQWESERNSARSPTHSYSERALTKLAAEDRGGYPWSCARIRTAEENQVNCSILDVRDFERRRF